MTYDSVVDIAGSTDVSNSDLAYSAGVLTGGPTV